MLIGTAVAYAAWFAGLQRLPAAAVGLVGLLNPVTGVVLGVVLAGEPFGPAQVFGLVLVLGGVVWGVLPHRRRMRRQESVAGRQPDEAPVPVSRGGMKA
jgi:probable blue pigment (indigoidine) exporter